MQREVILVCGVTGSGKTNWARQYTKTIKRLFVYDIAASFDVRYSAVEDIAEFSDAPTTEFRIGTYNPYDAEVLTACAYLTGNCHLVLEEISTLYSIGARINGPLQEAVLLGRQRSLSLVILSQRASYIPITLRSQASRIISFRQQEPADLKWLTDFMGKEALALPSLPDLECLDWHKGEIARYTTSYYNTQGTQDTPTDTYTTYGVTNSEESGTI